MVSVTYRPPDMDAPRISESIKVYPALKRLMRKLRYPEMVRKETSDKLSALAGRYVKLTKSRVYDAIMDPYEGNAFVRDIRALAACVLAQDETRGKRKRKTVSAQSKQRRVLTKKVARFMDAQLLHSSLKGKRSRNIRPAESLRKSKP